jgi:regulator of sigma E protease
MNILSAVWATGALFIGIIAINFIIAFHELGHWLFCKLFGIRTPSFSIGFGPRLISKKIGSTLFAFSAIPFGGYVEIAGSEEIGQGDQLDAKANDKDSINHKPYWQKLCVMLGGIFFNCILAFAIFVCLWQTGIPKTTFFSTLTAPIIDSVQPGSPAELAGLSKGQRITKFNNQPINTIQELANLIKENKNKKIAITKASLVQKCSIVGKCTEEEEIQTVEITLDVHPENSSWGYLGAQYQLPDSLKSNSFIDSLTKSWHMVSYIFKGTLQGLFHSISKKSTAGMGGPLRLFSDATEQIYRGFSHLLLLMANISLGLAVINLMPLPVFDGGQVVTFSIEALIGKSLPEKARYLIHLITALILIAFLLYLSFKDSLHIFEKLKTYLQ